MMNMIVDHSFKIDQFQSKLNFLQSSFNKNKALNTAEIEAKELLEKDLSRSI